MTRAPASLIREDLRTCGPAPSETRAGMSDMREAPQSINGWLAYPEEAQCLTPEGPGRPGLPVARMQGRAGPVEG